MPLPKRFSASVPIPAVNGKESSAEYDAKINAAHMFGQQVWGRAFSKDDDSNAAFLFRNGKGQTLTGTEMKTDAVTGETKYQFGINAMAAYFENEPNGSLNVFWPEDKQFHAMSYDKNTKEFVVSEEPVKPAPEPKRPTLWDKFKNLFVKQEVVTRHKYWENQKKNFDRNLDLARSAAGRLGIGEVKEPQKTEPVKQEKTAEKTVEKAAEKQGPQEEKEAVSQFKETPEQKVAYEQKLAAMEAESKELTGKPSGILHGMAIKALKNIHDRLVNKGRPNKETLSDMKILITDRIMMNDRSIENVQLLSVEDHEKFAELGKSVNSEADVKAFVDSLDLGQAYRNLNSMMFHVRSDVPGKTTTTVHHGAPDLMAGFVYRDVAQKMCRQYALEPDVKLGTPETLKQLQAEKNGPQQEPEKLPVVQNEDLAVSNGGVPGLH